MTPQFKLTLTTFVFLCLVSVLCGSERPNVILVMADDLGWGDPQCFNAKSLIRTPHIDAMAKAGLKFSRFYSAAPVCSPTRGSCLTGRHPYRYGVYTANAGHLKQEEIALPELLHEAGYLTGHFGKWHLGTLTTKWTVNAKRVYRLWRREGLKVPKKQRKTRHSGQRENGCDHHRSDHPDDVWAWDFVFDRTSNGTMLKWLVIVDEFTRECLCLHVDRNIRSDDVITELAKLFATRGLPNHIRSDNGSEFTASVIRSWLEKLELEVLYVEPGSPWENGYVESFNSRLRDEFLSLEEFENLPAARSLTARFRHDYNARRPHSSLGYLTPSDFASQWPASAQSAAIPSLQPATTATQSQPLTQPVLS